ncbi:hypothetical protein [Streptomyces sp. NPDC086989]
MYAHIGAEDGAPADPTLWIIEPVAKVIVTAAELSVDDEYAFVPRGRG